MQRLRKGDEVIVIAGKDKGKRGTVLKVLSEHDKVLVENINIAKKHTKPDPNVGKEGGILSIEMPIHASNIALYDSVSKGGSRVAYKTLDDGRKVRFFKSSNEVVDI